MPRCFQELEPVLERQGYQADGLLEVLAEAQRLYGCLSEDLLRYVAQVLHLPLSRVHGTASFYHLFRLRPPPPMPAWSAPVPPATCAGRDGCWKSSGNRSTRRRSSWDPFAAWAPAAELPWWWWMERSGTTRPQPQCCRKYGG